MATRSQPSETFTPSNTVILPASGSRQVTPEDIARRAYEIYEARGRTGGDALTDWLRAEGELKGMRES